MTVSVALLMPASSPGCRSITSRLKPRRSVQRRYMRSSISAQSCDSVPPAPGWIVTIAFLRSCSPPSIFLVSPASTCAPSSSSARAEIVGDRLAGLRPLDQHGEIVEPRFSDSLRSRSSSSRRRRCSSFCAPAWSFQKSGSATRSSILASSSAGRAASKIAPQVAGAARQILVPAKLLVELKHRQKC